MTQLLKETYLLDFNSVSIKNLINQKKWNKLDNYNRIISAYNFVRDDIRFGYNRQDKTPASKILEDGYGQCNTKGILLMALFRVLGIPCRFHGFTIDKELQKGAISGIWYKLAPQEIIHSWVEIYFEDRWYNLEGFILDKIYLNKLQSKYSNISGEFSGYGVACKKFQKPDIEWDRNDTYIQKEGINQDFGIFDDPDTFFENYEQYLSPIKKFVYRNITRHNMNRNVAKIREY